MSLLEITFSPTGGTQKVADMLAGEFGTASKVDLTDAETDFASIALNKEDIAVVAIPSFGGRVPGLAAERLKRLQGNQAKCIIVCTYGNRAYEDTLVELQDIAKESGFDVIAAVAAVTEHSIMHQYAAGRPDSADEAELRKFAGQIKEKLNGGVSGAGALALPGNRPYKKAGNAGFVPKAGSGCTNCGLCAAKCPSQAIDRENCKKVDSSKCISCMRCIAICPQSARSLNKVMVSAISLAMKKACSGRKENELFL